jgi:hypothetical protein
MTRTSNAWYRATSAVLAIALSTQSVLAQEVAGATPQGAVSEPAPATDPGLYQPKDKDERGLWMQMEEAERSLKTSAAVIRDPELNAYIRGLICKTAGEAECRNVRLYIMRTPYFNASMSMNGVMQVYSGLLLRTQNEAQLAAVVGHEYAHFQRQHSLKLFRDIKSKSNSMVWLSFIGIGLIASIGMTASLFKYSRDMEHEADIGGLKMLANAGYDTREAAKVWEQLRAEMDATAEARSTKSKKDKDGGMFATHPPTAERVVYLTKQASELPGVPDATGSAAYQQAMAKWWPQFIDDQLKGNDFGASDFLLKSLAGENWTPWLLYARGELYRRRSIGSDLDEAIRFYGDGMAAGGVLPELWRGRGLALIKLGRSDEGKVDLKEYLRRAPDASDAAMMAMMAGGTA